MFAQGYLFREPPKPGHFSLDSLKSWGLSVRRLGRVVYNLGLPQTGPQPKGSL